MEIRPAILPDSLSVAEIHVESWKYAYRGLVPDSVLDSITVKTRMKHWVKAIEAGSPRLRIAEKDSVIVGWVAFGPSRDEDASPKTGEIEAIYVHPGHWGKGIGKALLAAAVQVLSAQKYARITLWVLSKNTRAARFYRGQGFQIDSCPPKVSKRGDQVLEELRYKIGLANGADDLDR